MFKTDSFLGNKKLNLNQNVWCDHATMQQDVLLHFWVIFYIEIRLKNEKNVTKKLISVQINFGWKVLIKYFYIK